ASHTPDWRQKHGATARAGTQNCALCHRQAACNACHQLPMPHPAKYQATHAADAKRQESACANCHKQSYCLKCHEKDEVHIPAASLPESRPDRMVDGKWLMAHDRPAAPSTINHQPSTIRSEAALMDELRQRLKNVEMQGCPVMEGRQQESRLPLPEPGP